MKPKFTLRDWETFDFIEMQIIINENNDSYGDENFERKRNNCDKAKEFLSRVAKLLPTGREEAATK